MQKLKHFLRTETVLSVAILLAGLSAIFVPPDRGYAEYIDFRTLAILFSLMAVMSGLRNQGVFDALGQALLKKCRTLNQILLVLMLLCYFGSMVITNDVALITFVPFTFVVLKLLGEDTFRRLAVPAVAIQTAAANLGSMMTPIGNPQNLYLYGKSGLQMGDFLLLMLPYGLASLILLALWTVKLGSSGSQVGIFWSENKNGSMDTKKIAVHLVLFALSLLAVMRILPVAFVFAAVLILVFLSDRKALAGVDYSLLLTFIAFFIFIGNLGRIPAFSGWLQGILEGREVPVAVLTSQVTSNVPAALLLSGFTDNIPGLLIGTNLGGLGTLIASMASLISYRQILQSIPDQKGRYFRMFTISNLILLAALMALHFLLSGM